MGILESINTRAKSAVRSWLGLEQSMNTSAETTAQKLILTYRNYYGGTHKVYLTDRQKAWLDQHGDNNLTFTVNHCGTVVDAVVERLRVTGFTSGDESISELLWEWWQANRMDVVQVEAHRYAVRDGECGIIATWDEEKRRPAYVLHPRYVSKDAGGDGYGVWVEYANDNWLTEPIRAVKRWTDDSNKERETVYYPDRIERFIRERNKWVEYKEEGGVWPTPWVDSAGAPLGIPVAHFRNSGLESELKPVIVLQDALNKAWLDIMAASDMTAFRMLAFFGWIPTTDGKEPESDGGNLVKVTPGQMLATRKKPGDASLQEIEPADLTPLLDVEDRIVFRMALISKTPASRFLTSRQVAAAETLKEQDEQLIGKVEEVQGLFGNGWEDLAAVSLNMARAFGGLSVPAELMLSTAWKPARDVDEAAQLANAKAKAALGVPFETCMAELGYDQKAIDDMKASPEYQNRLAMMTLSVGGS